MKVLTICQGGHVRSVGMKYLLRYKYGHEAISAGWETVSSDTLRMLCDWADVVVIMQPKFERYISPDFKEKLLCYDVGEDNYGNPFHPILLGSLEKMIETHGVFNGSVITSAG